MLMITEAHRLRELLSPSEVSAIADQVAEKLAGHLNNQPKYLGRDEMARDLGISVPTLDRWCKRKILPAIKLDGRVLFDPAQVRDALREKGGAA